MSIYFLSFIIFVIITFISGVFIYRRNKNTGGIFFLIFSIAIPLWFVLFFLSFDASYGSSVILQIYRFQYSLSIIGFYSVLLFVLFFGDISKSFIQYKKYIYGVFFSIFLLTNFTPFVLKGVKYSNEISSYAEVYGSLYLVVVGLYALLFPAFSYVSYYKLKRLNNLDKVRISYIVLGFFTFMTLILVLTVFIPYFSQDSSQLYLERYLPFLMLPFIISVLYSNYRYDFSDYKIYIINIFIYGASIVGSIGGLFFMHVFFGYLSNGFNNFWNITRNPTWFDIFIGILLFTVFFRVLKQFNIQDMIRKKLRDLQEYIPFITNIPSLSIFLNEKFKTDFFIQHASISETPAAFPHTCQLFSENKKMIYFINDFVFLENNKNKINIKKIEKEIGLDVHIVFPLFGSEGNVEALFFLGKKVFADAYTRQELLSLQEFSLFLQGHLKYISIYSEIQELTLNLDKKVDEKTIEYNNLISKQKEFIAYVGHEIKNPITNALFLTEALRELSQDNGDKQIIEDSGILYDELIKISKLVKNIFSAEKFDLGKIKLYKQRINISDFLTQEISAFGYKFPNIEFISDIQDSIKGEIDETQFRQVVQNLMNNAIKFLNQKHPKIKITLRKKQNKVILSIEDNGKGLKNIDIRKVFDKYVTGTGDSIGLGMGLYLCKKIVELHGGSIKAEPSEELAGALFIISI